MPPDDENVGLRRRKSKYNDDAHNDFVFIVHTTR